MEQPTLAIVIPCYNEEECIDKTTERLLEVLSDLKNKNEISANSFIFCVDDGSKDRTWEIIKKYNKETNGKVKGISFSRNFGNQKAILAGLFEAEKYGADCYITIDADLQQDENKIPEFLQKFGNGAQIVCGVKKNRKVDGFLKKNTAFVFYRLMNSIGVNIKINHSDYRLVSKRIVDVLKTYPETNLFLRGIFNELGFKQDYVYFDVKERFAGKTKYTLCSLVRLALEGITSFSIAPLRFVTFIGFLMAALSFLGGIETIIAKYFGEFMVPGWATIMVATGFIGGIQIFCIGVIGEYVGQLFQEVKARPRYIIEDETK